MTSNNLLSQTKDICRVYDINPTKSKGQNFLINEGIYDQIVSLAAINKDDVVLEIGPGLGFLTGKLAEKAKKVIAVELDKAIFNFLKVKFALSKNVKLINDDILRFRADSEKDLVPGKYKIVANLPYNITSIFLRTFLSGNHKPQSLVLMLQKEVAERIIAPASQSTLLSLSVQFYAEPKILAIVGKEEFWPSPKVDSALIGFNVRSKSLLPQADEKNFFRLLKIAFSAKRKMLKNNLMNSRLFKEDDLVLAFSETGLKINIRPQELGLNSWLELFAKLQKFMI